MEKKQKNLFVPLIVKLIITMHREKIGKKNMLMKSHTTHYFSKMLEERWLFGIS